MGLDAIMLIIFVAVVILGFVKKVNVGILSIAVAVVLGKVFGISNSVIFAGFSTSLFMTLVGITFLFAIVNSTGALELMSKKIICLVGKKTWLIPIFIYIAGFVLAAVGPGAIPALAIIPPLAVTMALEVGYNPVMLALVGEAGLMAGRFSPITPEGVLVSGLAAEQGITNIIGNALLTNTIMTSVYALLIYLFYKSYRVHIPAGLNLSAKEEKFTKNQIISLLGILAMLILIIFVKINVGLAAFFVGAVLVFFNVAEESSVIKAVPWNTVMLVLGVGVLMNLVKEMGGIDLLSNLLASIMTPRTAAPIMGVSAGLLSWVSSALGVVYPTLVPTVGGIVAKLGGGTSAAALIAAIGAGGSCAGISPASTGGALILAALASNKKDFTKEEENKTFVNLFLWAVFALGLIAFMAFIGTFSILA